MEYLDTINKQLADNFGKTEDKSNYRVVWSEDQFEKRLTTHTKDGFQLLTPVVLELPKYRQWIQDKYILERLCVVPIETDLVTPLSYEPLWVFSDKQGNAIAPNWLACKFIAETVNRNIQQAGNYVKYKDPEADLTDSQLREKREVELAELTRALFPNETDTGDALSYKEGISVPHNYPEFEKGRKVTID